VSSGILLADSRMRIFINHLFVNLWVIDDCCIFKTKYVLLTMVHVVAGFREVPANNFFAKVDLPK
jgi:hypothetical protein